MRLSRNSLTSTNRRALSTPQNRMKAAGMDRGRRTQKSAEIKFANQRIIRKASQTDKQLQTVCEVNSTSSFLPFFSNSHNPLHQPTATIAAHIGKQRKQFNPSSQPASHFSTIFHVLILPVSHQNLITSSFFLVLRSLFSITFTRIIPSHHALQR